MKTRPGGYEDTLFYKGGEQGAGKIFNEGIKGTKKHDTGAGRARSGNFRSNIQRMGKEPVRDLDREILQAGGAVRSQGAGYFFTRYVI